MAEPPAPAEPPEPVEPAELPKPAEPVSVTGPAPRVLVTVCADPAGPVPAALAPVLGVVLPSTPNTLASTGPGANTVLWLGPDEWLVLAGRWTAPAAAELERALRAAAGAEPAAVVDVSAGWAVLELAGAAGPDLLAGCCALDLHPRVFGPGRCAQTLLAGVPVLLAHPAPAHWLVLTRPSYIGHVRAWLRAGAGGPA